MTDTKTLPFFRIGGLQAELNNPADADLLDSLWQRAASGSLNGLPAFSTTLYCVFHNYRDHGGCLVTLGRLISTDAELPTDCADVWIAPQQYQTQTLPQAAALSEAAAVLMQNRHPERRYHADFASFPAVGSPTLYIGLQGETEIEEH